jgi:hypothetical protein
MGSKVTLPEIKDDLYFDGYPRSGNTYFIGLIKRMYPDIKYSSHLHTISGIKIAFKRNISVVIIIRNPEDAIVSNMFRVINSKGKKANQELADDLTRRYIDYYSFVLTNRKRLRVLNFNELIEKEQILMNILSETIGVKKYTDESFELLLKENDEIMKNMEKNKDDNVSSMPNKRRKAFKRENLELVQFSKHYSEANLIYNKLTRRLYETPGNSHPVP